MASSNLSFWLHLDSDNSLCGSLASKTFIIDVAHVNEGTSWDLISRSSWRRLRAGRGWVTVDLVEVSVGSWTERSVRTVAADRGKRLSGGCVGVLLVIDVQEYVLTLSWRGCMSLLLIFRGLKHISSRGSKVRLAWISTWHGCQTWWTTRVSWSRPIPHTEVSCPHWRTCGSHFVVRVNDLVHLGLHWQNRISDVFWLSANKF